MRTIPEVVAGLRALADQLERRRDYPRTTLTAYQRRESFPPPPDFDPATQVYHQPPDKVISGYVVLIGDDARQEWLIEQMQTLFAPEPPPPPNPDDFELKPQ